MPNPESGGNPVLRIKGKSLLPIVQGGMGVASPRTGSRGTLPAPERSERCRAWICGAIIPT